jgi:hypothetical protein
MCLQCASIKFTLCHSSSSLLPDFLKHFNSFRYSISIQVCRVLQSILIPFASLFAPPSLLGPTSKQNLFYISVIFLRTRFYNFYETTEKRYTMMETTWGWWRPHEGDEDHMRVMKWQYDEFFVVLPTYNGCMGDTLWYLLTCLKCLRWIFPLHHCLSSPLHPS